MIVNWWSSQVTPVLWTSQMSINDASIIVIDDFRVMLQIVASLTDNSRGIIYDNNIPETDQFENCRNLINNLFNFVQFFLSSKYS
jgi:hypothetical protein